MSTIVYQTNKKTGTVYAYRSETFRDPETKKPRSKRTYLGRVDPVTHEIISKAESGKRNRSRLSEDHTQTPSSKNLDATVNRVKDLENQLKELQQSIQALKDYFDSTDRLLKEINKLTSSVPPLETDT